MSRMINGLKRTASLCVAVLMVITALPQLAVTTFAAEAPAGYTTDSYGLMAWRQNSNDGWGEGSTLSYDVKGYVNGSWRQVTYNDGGFHSMVWPQEAQSSVQITCTPSFVVEGQAVMFTYNVTNTSAAPVSNFRFFLASDTAIDGYDASSNTVDEDNVITMSRNETGVSLFAFSTTEGGIAIPTEYSGENSYGRARGGSDPSLTARVANAGDSAFVTYFPLTTLAPGQSTEYTLVVGMADKSAIAGIINSVKKALLKTGLDYENECLKDLTPGGTYILKDRDNGAIEYEVKAGEDGTIPLTGTDVNGNAYDFIGKTITIY
ncbi:MAG: hypothetical protein II765_02745, partial [Lachnospiraceae bacterium]|nr:hypothetical protein [Lachnospiraceae bacterium]